MLAPVLICLIFVGKPVEANCAGFLFSVLELLKRCLKIKLCCLPFSFVVYVCGDVHIKQIVQAPIFICWLCLWGCPLKHFVLATISIVWFYRGMPDEAKCVGSHFNFQICVWHEWSICSGLFQLSCAHYIIILHHLILILGGYKGFISCVVFQMNGDGSSVGADYVYFA